jgi:hypothetical protein
MNSVSNKPLLLTKVGATLKEKISLYQKQYEILLNKESIYYGDDFQKKLEQMNRLSDISLILDNPFGGIQSMDSFLNQSPEYGDIQTKKMERQNDFISHLKDLHESKKIIEEEYGKIMDELVQNLENKDLSKDDKTILCNTAFVKLATIHAKMAEKAHNLKNLNEHYTTRDYSIGFTWEQRYQYMHRCLQNLEVIIEAHQDLDERVDHLCQEYGLNKQDVFPKSASARLSKQIEDYRKLHNYILDTEDEYEEYMSQTREINGVLSSIMKHSYNDYIASIQFCECILKSTLSSHG